jgi:hypothetical protein
MPTTEIPGFLKKRKLLWETKDADTMAKYGDLYLGEGSVDDAVDFYERAKHNDGFKKVLQIAKSEGNLYLYRKMCRLLKIQPDKAALEEVGNKAIELGKFSMALEAFKSAGNTMMIEKVEGLMGKKKEEKES